MYNLIQSFPIYCDHYVMRLKSNYDHNLYCIVTLIKKYFHSFIQSLQKLGLKQGKQFTIKSINISENASKNT